MHTGIDWDAVRVMTTYIAAIALATWIYVTSHNDDDEGRPA